MKRTKRVLALLLCAALIFALAACKSKGSGEAAELTTASYHTAKNGVIKVAVLPDASAIGLYQLFDSSRYEIKLVQNADEALTLLSGGEADVAACPADAVTDDLRVIGVISAATVTITQVSEDAKPTVQKTGVPTCFVAKADAEDALVAAFVSDAQISVETLYRDLSAAADAINAKAGLPFQVSDGTIESCDIVYLTGEEMQTLLASPYDTASDDTTAAATDDDTTAPED